jgi:F-type H+-transporting ATPase subunit epsilon
MLKLEIVTPERRVLDTEADYVSLPTASGEAGILPNHAPLITALKPGILTYSTKSANERLAVSSGFAEVSSDMVSVLVDTAEAGADIDVEAARRDRESAEKALVSAGTVDVEAASESQEAVEYAAARLEVAGGR